MFSNLLESSSNAATVVLFADKTNPYCMARKVVKEACEDLKVEMQELHYHDEMESLQIMEISIIPAVVLIRAGTGRVIMANNEPIFNIRLQLVAAGVSLP